MWKEELAKQSHCCFGELCWVTASAGGFRGEVSHFWGIQGETGAVTTKGFVLVLATSCSGPLSLLTFCKEDCAAFAAKVESEQFSAVHWVYL